MSNRGSFITNKITGSPPYYLEHWLEFEWEVVSQSISNSTTTIDWVVRGGNYGASSRYAEVGPTTTVVNGSSNVASRRTVYSETLVDSGTTIIEHTSAGSASFTASIATSIISSSTNARGSGSWQLPKIPKPSTADVPETMNIDGTYSVPIYKNVTTNKHLVEIKDGKGEYTDLTEIVTTTPVDISLTKTILKNNFVLNSDKYIATVNIATYAEVNGRDVLIGNRAYNTTLVMPEEIGRPTPPLTYGIKLTPTGAIVTFNGAEPKYNSIIIGYEGESTEGTTFSIKDNVLTSVVPDGFDGDVTLKIYTKDSRGFRSLPLTITYTPEVTKDKLYVNNTWVKGISYIFVDNAWHKVKRYAYVGGKWQ